LIVCSQELIGEMRRGKAAEGLREEEGVEIVSEGIGG
jgi:hypothetical protein